MGIFDSTANAMGFSKFGISGFSVMNMLVYGALFGIFCIITGFVIYFIIQKLRFNQKIVIFKKINGRFEPTKKDRGMFIKHGKGGDTILFIRRLKKYQPTPSIQTGRNTFWFWLREDGELINFGPGDFDAQARELGARFLDKEMRYARVSLQETMKERYDKPKIWEKYGGMIINLAAVSIILVFFFLIVREFLGSLGALSQVLEKAEEVVITLNNVCTGGPGYVPAG